VPVATGENTRTSARTKTRTVNGIRILREKS